MLSGGQRLLAESAPPLFFLETHNHTLLASLAQVAGCLRIAADSLGACPRVLPATSLTSDCCPTACECSCLIPVASDCCQTAPSERM